MWRIVSSLLLAGLGALLLWGCSSRPEYTAREEPWRDRDEQACLAANVVRETRFVQARSALGGPSMCGAARPFEMAGTQDGRIGFKPTALLRCPMVPAVERWIANTIEPAARRHLGAPVVEMKVAASYACRPINHQSGGRLSEHGRANAIDIAAFHLADGRVVTVKDGWYGSGQERAFLRAVHGGACGEFTTVLGPEADRFHRDHLHVDLARHGRDGTYRVCQ